MQKNDDGKKNCGKKDDGKKDDGKKIIMKMSQESDANIISCGLTQLGV